MSETLPLEDLLAQSPERVDQLARCMRDAFNRHDSGQAPLDWDKADEERREAWRVCARSALHVLRSTASRPQRKSKAPTLPENVVQIRQEPERLLWVCNCGCTVHYHHADGRVECCECESIATGLTGEWRAPLPDEPDKARPLDSSTFKLVRLDSVKTFFRRRLEDEEQSVAVAVLYPDGGLSTYLDHDLDDASAARRGMETAAQRFADIIEGRKADG